jgi:hypothetical protein
VAVSSEGYFQESAYQLVTQASPGGKDTIWVYAGVLPAPVGADSITLVMYLPGQEWIMKVTPLPQEEGTRDTGGTLVLPYPKYGNPDINGVASVAVLRSTACNPNMPYEITVIRSSDKK